MHNWDYPKTKDLLKNEVWYLERMLNFGLGGEKIRQSTLLRNFNKIKIPKDTRAFLELLLWDKQF